MRTQQTGNKRELPSSVKLHLKTNKNPNKKSSRNLILNSEILRMSLKELSKRQEFSPLFPLNIILEVSVSIVKYEKKNKGKELEKIHSHCSQMI